MTLKRQMFWNQKKKGVEMSDSLHQRLLDATGIKTANCESCKHIQYESDGDYCERNWMECRKRPSNHNLTSFPFKKSMKCWEPSFWESKFADSFDEEEVKVEDAIEEFEAAVKKEERSGNE